MDNFDQTEKKLAQAHIPFHKANDGDYIHDQSSGERLLVISSLEEIVNGLCIGVNYTCKLDTSLGSHEVTLKDGVISEIGEVTRRLGPWGKRQYRYWIER